MTAPDDRDGSGVDTPLRRIAAHMAALTWLIALLPLALAAELAPAAESGLLIVADGIPQPLATGGGDVARGRALIVARESANCVLCHAVPDPAVRFSGDVGPSLAGIGARMTEAQLRLRVVDNARVNPESVMPSYYRTSGLDRVATPYAGKPILSAREVEDVVAFLATLR